MKKIIYLTLLLGILNITVNAQVFKTNGNQAVIGRMLITPGGVESDNAYNGNLVITKPTATGQYINLIRQGTYAWSIGTVYNNSTFAIGNSASNDASFTNPFFTIDPNGGRIGIGNPSPSTKLDIAAVNGEGIRIGKVGDVGNYTVPLNSLSAQYNIDFTGYRDIAADQVGARIAALRFNCYQSNVSAIQKTGLAFYTNPSGVNTGTTDLVERMRIAPNGFIGIGTFDPQNLLDVKGTIRATEVLVQSVDQFADFVFDPNYKLLPLTEVNSYVKSNKHLPGIPSANEVKENGINLTEMQVKLLQKIEELTLYSIKQQEEIQLLKSEIESLKNR